jgi:hypothetical protein
MRGAFEIVELPASQRPLEHRIDQNYQRHAMFA